MKLLPLAFLALTVLIPPVCGQTASKVCPDPASPCRSRHKMFAKYELSFILPGSIKPNTTYESGQFYAVILKTFSDPECDQGEYSTEAERFRQEAQKFFPGKKVFADHQCPDMGAVAYRIEGEPNAGAFVAVYAAETRPDADLILKKAKEKYPRARIAKMQVSFEQIVQ